MLNFICISLTLFHVKRSNNNTICVQIFARRKFSPPTQRVLQLAGLGEIFIQGKQVYLSQSWQHVASIHVHLLTVHTNKP